MELLWSFLCLLIHIMKYLLGVKGWDIGIDLVFEDVAEQSPKDYQCTLWQDRQCMNIWVALYSHQFSVFCWSHLFGCMVVVVLFSWWAMRFEHALTCWFPIGNPLQGVFSNCLLTFILDSLFHWVEKWFILYIFVLLILENTETKINVSIPL